MPTHSDAPRGYALMAVVVITVLIISGASILLFIGKDASLSAVEEKRGTEAHGIALAGLEWMLANIATQGAKDRAVEVALSTDPTASFVGEPGAKNIYRFDANTPRGGVPTTPPSVGISNADWTALGNGHYGLTVTIDPLDTRRSILVRSVAVVGDKVVVLESNLVLNIVQTVPAGITGCFDASFEVKFDDKEGPYDYVGNIRYDGGTGVPFALSSDHNRMNGLAREKDSDEPAITGIDGTFTQGRRWRGTQSLRSNVLAPACLSGAEASLCPAVSNRFGGTQSTALRNDDVGPLALWEKNPYIANDPRIVDVFSGVATVAAGGLRLGANGFVYNSGVPTNITSYNTSTAVTNQRGFPIIAYDKHPTTQSNANGGFLVENDWAGDKDAEAKRGFYACDSAADSDGDGIDSSDAGDGHLECLVGKSDGTSANWTDGDVQASGRAWGFAQATLRQCTGSGDSIDVVTGAPWFDKVNNPNGIRCSNGFQWLENVAACLIVPSNASKSAALSGNNLRDPFSNASPASADVDNFKGCHPGCLIATDLNADNVITNEDRPFRSSCINLAAKVSTYGPGALPEKDNGTQFDTAYGTGLTGTATQRWEAYNRSRAVGVNLASLPLVIDATQPARFFPAAVGSTAIPGGAISERGNGSFITRLDMTDRGPLGTCEQNCLAYGWGKDVTWGAHRNGESVVFPTAGGASGVTTMPVSTAATTTDRNCMAKVPEHSGTGVPSFVIEHCNMDSDLDGLMDRKSYALASSYREECADPHDGVAWTPAFNISSGNTNLNGAGCVNRMPGMSDDTAPNRILPFCEDGNDADLQEGVAQLENLARVVNSSEFNKTSLDNGEGWFGGARCHMGSAMGTAAANNGFPAVPAFVHSGSHTGAIASLNLNDEDRLGHADYWMEDVCPAPVVMRLDSNAEVNVKKVCGCGILIITENSLRFSAGSHLMWRGVVIWNMKTAGKELQIGGNGASTFVVEGAMLMTGKEGMQIRIDKDLTNNNISNNPKGTVKMHFNLNPRAIEDAFTKIKLPVRTIRRIQ